MDFPYKKVLVLGCGGAGKSTFSIDMGNRFSIPVVHLDQLYWLPNWVQRENDEFDQLISEALQKPSWIIDGNYKRTLKWRLEYADLAILFDISEEMCFKGVQERIAKYNGQSRPDMTEGCPEQYDPEFQSWIRDFRKDILPEVIKILNESHKEYIIFKSREDAWKWLESFKPVSLHHI